jgi:Zn-dependent protease
MIGRYSFELGRLFGIRIKLDWSLVVIFALVAISLGIGVLPAWHPNWGAPLIWGVAGAAAALFFASVLVHELSHALVGRAFGIPVSSITLFLFGGVASVDEEPDSPKKEFLMAGVGPVVSIALGVVATLLGSVTASFTVEAGTDPEHLMAHVGPVTTLLLWLGPINIVLGVFNLLPGLPLDGGRVLRAALWATTGSLHRATLWSARMGQLIGVAFMLAGVAMAFGVAIPLFGRGLFSGAWLSLVGWFLAGAALASYRQLQLREALQGVPISNLTRADDLPRVSATVPVSQLVSECMVQGQQPLLLVESPDSGQVLGIVDGSRVRALPRERWERATAGEIAAPIASLARIDARQDAYFALRMFGRHDATALVVQDGGTPVGIVLLADLTRYLERTQGRPGSPRGGRLARVS